MKASLTCPQLEVDRFTHDIKSPLMVLGMISSTLKDLPENKKNLLHFSLKRINAMVEDLQKLKIEPKKTRISEKIKLGFLLKNLIIEKNYEYRNRNINFIFFLKSDFNNEFVSGKRSSFNRNFSNLINNAVESIPHNSNGEIKIIGEIKNKSLNIKIIDNGCGIKKKIIRKIGLKGYSFNKKKGSGLGVFSALNYFKSLNGNLSVQSTLNKGTSININLPIFNTNHIK